MLPAFRTGELVGIPLFIIDEGISAVGCWTPRYVLLCLHAVLQAVAIEELDLLMGEKIYNVCHEVNFCFATQLRAEEGAFAVLYLILQILLDAIEVVHVGAFD